MDLIPGARKLAYILAVPSWRHALLRYRVAAGVEHRNVLRSLGEIRVVVDIGANRGQFALAGRHFLSIGISVWDGPRGEPPAAAFTGVLNVYLCV